MKRYHCDVWEIIEASDGAWVRYSDAQAVIEAAKEFRDDVAEIIGPDGCPCQDARVCQEKDAANFLNALANFNYAIALAEGGKS